MMSFAATSILTFFIGEPARTISILRERVQTVVHGKPWLASRLQTVDGDVKLTATNPQTWSSYFEVIEGRGR